ncbi:hypothetical protein M595_3105 [Lyngbya aestuarii BL J]|uniref:Uncharacterized protein n=1 Tax=Lyngbya aestuarii BL J TaxID=1348334 RepID=U7Q9H1_9CYAN|nr:hypothetical protein M595_6191 [Lyngbya aestuarii BL J]ERT06917.1 hypothetical protein M595_3105 [Lyngbya aestuarii BL J]
MIAGSEVVRIKSLNLLEIIQGEAQIILPFFFLLKLQWLAE